LHESQPAIARYDPSFEPRLFDSDFTRLSKPNRYFPLHIGNGDIDGSFKADRDGSEPGIIFQARPCVGQTYIEEFSLRNAEDATDILSTTFPRPTLMAKKRS
jgi:hypothetical protein